MALKVFTDNLSCIVTHFVQTKYSGMMLRTSQNQRSCGITSRCLCRTMDQRLCCSRTMPVFMLPERCRMNFRSETSTPCPVLVSSLSRLAYDNALLAGSPHVLLVRIQRVVNCSVRLIGTASKSSQITHLIYGLHWRPISSRSQYKIAFICFHVVSGTAHPYLSELLHFYFPSHSLRSSSDIPCSNDGQEDPEEESLSIYRTCQLEHYFFVCSFSSKSKLKTHAFSYAY